MAMNDCLLFINLCGIIRLKGILELGSFGETAAIPDFASIQRYESFFTTAVSMTYLR